MTFGVGDLSAINAVAGAFAEYIPVVVLSSAASSTAVTDGSFLPLTQSHAVDTDMPGHEMVHHSLVHSGLDVYQKACFTCFTHAAHQLTLLSRAFPRRCSSA